MTNVKLGCRVAGDGSSGLEAGCTLRGWDQDLPLHVTPPGAWSPFPGHTLSSALLISIHLCFKLKRFERVPQKVCRALLFTSTLLKPKIKNTFCLLHLNGNLW